MSETVVTRDAQVLRAFVERVDQTDPRAFNNLGVLYHSKGMGREAVDAFLRAIALDPRMQTAVRNLEVAAAVDGASETYLASLSERLVHDPDDRDAAREQGRLLRLIGRHTEAAQKLDALIAEDPDDAPALFERGLLEQRVGDLRKAQRWFERASNADELNVFSRLHLAEVLYQRGQNEQALAALDNLLLINDEIADAHLLRGFVLGDMGRHESGMEAARRATALNPAIATAQANLSLEKVLSSGAHAAVDPNTPPAGESLRTTAGEPPHYNLGLAFRQRGYFAEARREFARALANGEDSRGVRHAVAELDLIEGRSGDAAATYVELLSQFGENARWRNEHGVAMHQAGSLQEAAESYRRALRCDPRYALAYANLGVALADMHESAAAREALQQAATIDPTLVHARLNLARLHLSQRDPLAALSLLRELSTFHASHADVWFEMGHALLALHRTADARQAYESALEQRSDHALAKHALAQLTASADDSADAMRLPAARTESRLSVAIELQRECPAATGAIELLSASSSNNRALMVQASAAPSDADRAVIGDAPSAIGDLFGGASGVFADEAHAIISAPAPATSDATLAEANAFAARAQHAQAFECYANVRAVAEWTGAHALWRQAALGEARSLCLLGRGSEALDLLEKLSHESVVGSEDEAETLALLAAAHAAEWTDTATEPRRARAAIARFMRLESRSAALLHFVGNVAVSLREEALALVLFRRALAVDPMRPTPRVAIARLLRLRNDLLAARLELVAALAVAPHLRDALLELARLNCANDRAPEALPLMVALLNREPADADALVLLAQALVQTGREKDARLAVARALRFRPQHGEALALASALAAAQLSPVPFSEGAAS